ncbi:MAG: hypothetical protein LBI04_09015, partial [Treponema sp.]|nr:hypothetical protein [Treponema sp.]
MKNLVIMLLLVSFSLTACSSPSDSGGGEYKTPTAADYDIGKLSQTVGSITAVTVTPKPGKSSGAITVYYEGIGSTSYAKTTTLPTAVGTYAVTFNVAAAPGFYAASGLSAGTLTITQAAGTFGSPAAINTIFTSTLTLANLSLPAGYTWNAPATSLSAGNGQSFPATYTDPSGIYNAVSGNIIVNVAKAGGTFGVPAAINTVYTSMQTLANLSLPTGYTWNTPAVSLNAGNGQQFPATYTDPNGNYESAGGNITVNVAKASGTFGTPTVINTTFTPMLTLADLTLQSGYAWNTPAVSLNAGNGQQFPATYTDPSGNYESAGGNITINVAKASGTFGAPAAININYSSALTLENLGLPPGYVWNNPATSLNVGNGQQFSATYTDPSGNYEAASGYIIVNVAEAIGNFGNPAAINTTYTPTLILANLNLPTGYTWDAPATALNAGNEQLFPATYTTPSGGYETASGNITINVAKASGTFGSHAAIDTTYAPTLTLANLSLSTGYIWNVQETVLNAGD